MTGQEQVLMVNDDLNAPTAGRPSWLEKFQVGALRRFAGGRRDRLVDIGCGAGRFLLSARGRFEHASGIEISPASAQFARNQGLKIASRIDEVEGEVGVATAWHSLEHFPAPELTALLTGLRRRLAAGGCVIVSVPNAASWQCRVLGRRYAFHDPPGHLHQFTPDSLSRLFAAHGFTCTGRLVSWPYNLFGWVQGLLNLGMPGHNHVYYRLKRGHPRASFARDVAGALLVPLAMAPALLLSLLDAVRLERQAVLTCRFELRR